MEPKKAFKGYKRSTRNSKAVRWYNPNLCLSHKLITWLPVLDILHAVIIKTGSKNFQRLVLYHLSMIAAKECKRGKTIMIQFSSSTERSRIVLRYPDRHLDLSIKSTDLSKGPWYFVYTCNRYLVYCGCFRNSSTVPFPPCRFMLHYFTNNGKKLQRKSERQLIPYVRTWFFWLL